MGRGKIIKKTFRLILDLEIEFKKKINRCDRCGVINNPRMLNTLLSRFFGQPGVYLELFKTWVVYEISFKEQVDEMKRVLKIQVDEEVMESLFKSCEPGIQEYFQKEKLKGDRFQKDSDYDHFFNQLPMPKVKSASFVEIKK